MRKRYAVATVAMLVAIASTLAFVNAQGAGKVVAFKAADLKVETNATDGDAGLQVFLDHEPWRSISIARPDGTKIFDITARGVLENYGLTELFSESSEPPFDEFPISEFKKLFPQGRYTFEGETIEGVRMRSRVPLTHNFPPGPEITSPADGSTVPASNTVVSWNPVAGVVAYQVVVTKENPLRVLEATVPSSATSFKVPETFMQPATDFKAEVLAIEASTNQTLTEVVFQTS